MSAYDNLTPMRKRFVDEYILHEGNATEAYLAAGYKTKRKNAESSASRLLKEEEIRKAIEERMQPDEMERAFTIRQMIKQVEDTALRREQKVVDEDDTYYSTPTFRDSLSAIEFFNKLIPLDEYARKENELKLKLLEAEVELKQTQAEALKAGKTDNGLYEKDFKDILYEFGEVEIDDDEDDE